MRFLRQSSVFAECERCGGRFDPVVGGVCSRCGRILCSEHLHGSLSRRLIAAFGARPVCIYCRASPDVSRDAASASREA